MLRRACHIFMLLMLLLPLSCVQRQEGALEGTVEPLGTAAEVIAQRDGKTVASLNVNPGDGTFRLALEPGTYDVRIFAPSAPFPAAFPGTVIEAGRTTVLPALYLAPSGSSASLSGIVTPAGVTIPDRDAELPDGARYSAGSTVVLPASITVPGKAAGKGADGAKIRTS